METKEMKIVAPEGYEVDKEKSTFEKIVFKKVSEYSKTWEEFCERNSDKCNESYIDIYSNIKELKSYKVRRVDVDRNLIPSKFAEPMLALMQLLTIREKEYTKGWEPDWSDERYKYVILCSGTNRIEVSISLIKTRPLSFPTTEMAEAFLNNWRDLIVVAKPLL